jgi:hypothetical protein
MNFQTLHLYDDYSIIPAITKNKIPDAKVLPQVWDNARGRYVGKWEEFQTRRATWDERERWFREDHNLAVIGGKISNNAVFVDFDHADAYDAWANENLGYPTVRTSRGYHVWLRYGQDVVPGNTNIALSDDPTIKVGEIRGEGGYVIAPPSIHQTGTEYQWYVGGPLDPPVIPNFQSLGIVKYNEPVIPTTRSDTTLPIGDVVDQIYQKYIAMGVPGNRNNAGFQMALQLRDNNVPLVEAERVMLAYQAASPGGDDPYTEYEALATVRATYRNRGSRDPWSRKVRSWEERLNDCLRAFSHV